MAYEERVQILSDAEQDDFYRPPIFTSNDQGVPGIFPPKKTKTLSVPVIRGL